MPIYYYYSSKFAMGVVVWWSFVDRWCFFKYVCGGNELKNEEGTGELVAVWWLDKHWSLKYLHHGYMQELSFSRAKMCGDLVSIWIYILCMWVHVYTLQGYVYLHLSFFLLVCLSVCLFAFVLESLPKTQFWSCLWWKHSVVSAPARIKFAEVYPLCFPFIVWLVHSSFSIMVYTGKLSVTLELALNLSQVQQW